MRNKGRTRASKSLAVGRPTFAAAKSLQLCLTLWDPIDGSPLGSSIHGIFQARVLEWGAIAFSKAHLCYSSIMHCKVFKEFYCHLDCLAALFVQKVSFNYQIQTINVNTVPLHL